MRILALETSGVAGSVAALQGESLLAQRQLAADDRSARTLAPQCQTLLALVGWRPADVQLVAVTAGPGSFTGLRVGVTMAKTWAYAVGADLVGVDTLEVIAEQAPADIADLWAASDAQRQQLFVARWARQPLGGWRSVVPTHIEDRAAWLRSLVAPTAVSGPALAACAGLLPPDVRVLDESLWAPLACAVGQVAWRHYQAGQRDDPMQLVPLYLRRTAAEEQWERRHGTGRAQC